MISRIGMKGWGRVIIKDREGVNTHLQGQIETALQSVTRLRFMELRLVCSTERVSLIPGVSESP